MKYIDLHKAYIVLDKIRQCIENFKLQEDKDLYQAKKNGQNQIIKEDQI